MILDVLIGIVLLTMLLIGWNRGLADTLIRLGLTVASLIVSVLLTQPVLGLLKTTPIYTNLSESFQQQVAAGQGSQLSDLLDISNLPANWINWLSGRLTGHDPATEAGRAAISDLLAERILSILIFVVIFFLAGLLLTLFSSRFTRMLDRVPLLGFANHLAGLLVGGILGAVIALALIFLTSAIAPWNMAAGSLLAESFVVRQLQAHDIIQTILSIFF